jgi:hypothetical protein
MPGLNFIYILANAVAKKCTKISAEMLVKQNSIFSAIFFMLAPLRIAQIC